MALEKQQRLVKRYFQKGDFNPRSRDQLLAFMESKGYSGGAPSEKTGKPTVDKKVLESLAKKDPLFQDILNHKAISKVRSTYVVGTEKRLDSNSRLHPTFNHKPSTMRLSCQNPNLQNVVADKSEDKEQGRIASGFRDCIVAEPGCLLLEADFAAIEAMLVGWLIRDPNFIRLATLGIHAWHASHILGKPVSLNGSDEDVGKELKKIKALSKPQYDRSKITIYGSLYAQSPYGLQKTYPEIFPTIADAERNQELLFQICPALKQWHDQTRLIAHKQGYLGLNQHPYKFRHWFWDVYSWNSRKGKYDLGADSKRVLAYGPQSIGYGILSDSVQRIAPRIQHCFRDNKTPIRALIHDSILAEIREDQLDHCLSVFKEEMSKPVRELPIPPEWGFGDYLSIGVAIKVGRDWGHMEDIDLGEVGVASDTTVKEFIEEPEDEEFS